MRTPSQLAAGILAKQEMNATVRSERKRTAEVLGRDKNFVDRAFRVAMSPSAWVLSCQVGLLFISLGWNDLEEAGC
jgi:hypothetical protein